MIAIGTRSKQVDPRPLPEKFHHLRVLIQKHQHPVMLGEWAQSVIQAVHRRLAVSAVDSEASRRALDSFQGLPLWRAVRDGARDPFGNCGPIVPHVATGDLDAIVDLMVASGCATVIHSSPRLFGDSTVVTQDESEPLDNKRSRGPDYRTSQERQNLRQKLVTELATIHQQLGKGLSLNDLHDRYPDFTLWDLLSPREQAELLTEEFRPRSYADSLVLRRYGLTSVDTLKKDRLKLRHRPKP